MQIAYLTTDDVNLSWAARTASECGAMLTPVLLEGVMPNGRFGAVLYDLDHQDPQQGKAVLADLLSNPPSLPVGLHGYSLGDEEMASLSANGVVVSQPFDPELVRSLCRAAGCSPAATAISVDDGLGSPGESDDPVTLCASVRSLAAECYRTVPRPAGTPIASPGEVAELLQRIDQLGQHVDQFRRLHKLQLGELRSWLGSLRRRIESLQLPLS
jgi:hypothetical protein